MIVEDEMIIDDDDVNAVVESESASSDSESD